MKLQTTYLSQSLVVLYIQMVQSLGLLIYFLLQATSQAVFLLIHYCQMMVKAMVLYYFIVEATRVGVSFNFKRRLGLVLAAFLVLVSMGLLTYIVLASVLRGTATFTCTEPIWIYVTGVEWVLCLSFLVVGAAVTQKLERLREYEALIVDRNRERQLWY